MRILALMVVLMMGAGPLLAVPSSNVSPETTLEQCRRELQPDSPLELRRRASLVVGKYLVPEASVLLGQCLKDEDAVVRRNALVSVGEEPFHLFRNQTGVLECLQDSDVNIRRLASSLMTQVLASSAGSRGSRPRLHGRLAELLNDALADEDAAVRRNVLVAVQDYGDFLQGKVVAALLKDSSAEVAVLAIRPYLMSDATPEAMLQTLLPLANHPDDAVRMALAAALAARPNSQLEKLYLALSADDVAEVRGYALTMLLAVNPNDHKTLMLAGQLLLDEQAPLESRRRILRGVRFLPEAEFWALMEPLLAVNQPTALREDAWRAIDTAVGVPEHLPMDRLAHEVIVEPDAVVRRIQLSLLRRHWGTVKLEALTALQTSSYEDVRRAVFSLDAALPNEQRGELTLNGLLDESEAVRLEAIRRLCTLRPADWKQLLCDSLEDPSNVIAAAAAQGLLPFAKSDSVIAAALHDYLPRCADAGLRQQLLRHVK
ncbi:MAG: hypothetical protein IKS83_07000 [Victivallales bacterium]|nr:hypothetical protein [Victivallales bacterium]